MRTWTRKRGIMKTGCDATAEKEGKQDIPSGVEEEEEEEE